MQTNDFSSWHVFIVCFSLLGQVACIVSVSPEPALVVEMSCRVFSIISSVCRQNISW